MKKYYWLALAVCLSGCASPLTSSSSGLNSLNSQLKSTQSSLASTDQVFTSALSSFAVLAESDDISDSDIASATRAFKKSQKSASKLMTNIDDTVSLLNSASSGNYSGVASSLLSTKNKLGPVLSLMSTMIRQAINATPVGTIYNTYQMLAGNTQLLSGLISRSYNALSSLYSYSELILLKSGPEWTV